MVSPVRVLLLADSHLGFDLPARPRARGRRRGPDFFLNLERALTPALRGEVDLVVHGGDLLYRRRVPPELVQAAMAPLFAVADRGVPVVLVPGNHERGAIPYPLLARHPRVHVVDRPRTVHLDALGLALSGWPYRPQMAGGGFEQLLEETGWRQRPAGLRLLCLHQLVEGARAGFPEQVFLEGRDVIPAGAIPSGWAAVLCGHVHRAQRLELRGDRPPVLYPGAIERTSFVERRERKGFLLLELEATSRGGELRRARFRPLPTRPMEIVELAAAPPASFLDRLGEALGAMPPDAVVKVRLRPPGPPPITTAVLRELAPATMTVGWGFWPVRSPVRPPLLG